MDISKILCIEDDLEFLSPLPSFPMCWDHGYVLLHFTYAVLWMEPGAVGTLGKLALYQLNYISGSPQDHYS